MSAGSIGIVHQQDLVAGGSKGVCIYGVGPRPRPQTVGHLETVVTSILDVLCM